MTEYDYSPAAYERYMAQQTRVSNWVSDTLQQSHSYSNPFVLSPTLRDRSFYDESDNRTVRPPPSRSKALDHRSSDSSSRPSRSRSKSYSGNQPYPDRGRELRPSPSRQRSQSQSRSSSTQRSVQVIYQPSPQHRSQSHAYPQPHVSPPTPATRMYTAPPGRATYQYPTGHGHTASRPAYVTQPAQGQSYQIYRDGPHTMSRDQLHRGSSQTHHYPSKSPQSYLVVQGGGPRAEYKRGPPIHAPVPTKPQSQQPLLKRLLGFVTMSPVGGRSGNGRGIKRASY